VLDGNGRPVPHTLVEVWQANAAGRYPHPRDQHNAPLDPNFPGAGAHADRRRGPLSLRDHPPGEYPWRNHYNAWRPAHIHFSLFGPAIATRLVTQMYFPGDPLMDDDPMFNSVPDERAPQAADLALRLGDDDSRDGARVQVRHRAARARRDADGKLPSGRADHAHLLLADDRAVPAHRHDVDGRRDDGRCFGAGERVTLGGRMIDADGLAVNDADARDLAGERARQVRASRGQPRPAGRSPGFTGFGRVYTDKDGAFRVHTIKPGRVPGPDGHAAGAAPERDDLHARAS
jgi:protocatechuate 3,4-dioxygenase beta subunit